MPNAELMQRVLEHITANTQEWNQGSWRTCFAGHTVKQAGYTIYGHSIVRLSERECTSVAELARDLLELSEIQAVQMFFGCISLRDLWMCANRITDGAIRVPAEITLGTYNMGVIEAALRNGVRGFGSSFAANFDELLRVTA